MRSLLLISLTVVAACSSQSNTEIKDPRLIKVDGVSLQLPGVFTEADGFYQDVTNPSNTISISGFPFVKISNWTKEQLFLTLEEQLRANTRTSGFTYKAISNQWYSLTNGNEMLKVKFEVTSDNVQRYATQYLVSSDSRSFMISVIHHRLDLEGVARSVTFDPDYSTYSPQDYVLSFETSHPHAKDAMRDFFFFNPKDSTAPFSNSAGNIAFYEYLYLKDRFPDLRAAAFVDTLFNLWHTPRFDLSITDWKDLKPVIDQNNLLTVGTIDNAIIGIGFGQFVLEGRIDDDIWVLTRRAIQREQNNELVSRCSDPEARRLGLDKLLKVIDRIGG
ncbi:MAG TPA: hypothetical protein VFE50_17085 [Cyclobacteriaceae bacterium]|nr:hypothetical protein [Cyclobacteriaceae bacterium]